MTTMDFKAISWVGDMYHRFETMCVDVVDETVYEDSVKYVENQVKTVGTCVQRFCSDVVQDILPVFSNDSLKPGNTGVKLVCYADDGVYHKSDVDFKREQVKSVGVHLSKDSRLASELDENVDNRLSSGSYESSSPCEMQSEKSATVKGLGLLVKQSGTEELFLCNDNKSEEKFNPSEISNPETEDLRLALVSNDSQSTSAIGNMSDETAEHATSITSNSSIPAVWKEVENDEDLARMSDSGSEESVWDEFEIDDIDKEAFRVSEQLSKLKLDESCVLVEKYEHSSVPHLEGKQRSYKKKIRDVLYLRRWSNNKNAKEYTDSSNNKSREIKVSASTSESGKINKFESSSLESGWEIL